MFLQKQIFGGYKIDLFLALTKWLSLFATIAYFWGLDNWY